jgi:hypothetical protein
MTLISLEKVIAHTKLSGKARTAVADGRGRRH